MDLAPNEEILLFSISPLLKQVICARASRREAKRLHSIFPLDAQLLWVVFGLYLPHNDKSNLLAAHPTTPLHSSYSTCHHHNQTWRHSIG
jgi:hypothetical protein